MDGVRQGCPLSAELFNIKTSDLEDMSKVQGGGASLGTIRVRTLSYADDLGVMAEDEKSLIGKMPVLAAKK